MPAAVKYLDILTMDNTPHLFSELRKNKAKLQQFLDACRNQHQEGETKLDELRETYRTRLTEAEEFFVRFRTDIEKVPFELAVEHWLDFHATAAGLDDACSVFEALVSEGVIRLEDAAGQILTLGDQAMLGHAGYVEEIRCLQTIPLRQRERMVSIYLQFSRHLAQATLGFVPAQADPDRLKVEKKTVPYDAFLDCSVPVRA